MQSHDHGLDALPDNVVAFPGAHRGGGTKVASAGPSAPASKRAIAVTGAELNARLLLLLGICATSAAIALSATHILQGS